MSITASEIQIGGLKKAVVVHRGNGRVEVLVDCDATDDAYVKIEMTGEQFARYVKRNELVQSIFPDLPKEVRETLISGTTPAEWRSMFEEGKPDYTAAELRAFGYVLPGGTK